MPLFLLNARDKPGALDVRMSNRPAHLDWAKAHADRILMAGPVFADDGETFAGSTFVVEFDSLRSSFLKEWKKFKGNSEFVLGKGSQLLYLKAIEGNILHCMTSGAASCPTFTVGNVDAGFYRVQLKGVVGIGDEGGAEVSVLTSVTSKKSSFAI